MHELGGEGLFDNIPNLLEPRLSDPLVLAQWIRRCLNCVRNVILTFDVRSEGFPRSLLSVSVVF